MVDVLGHEIHIGDKVLRASTWGHQGIQWSMHEVLGITPKMLRVTDSDEWVRKDYKLITPNNVVVATEEDYKNWQEDENAG